MKSRIILIAIIILIIVVVAAWLFLGRSTPVPSAQTGASQGQLPTVNTGAPSQSQFSPVDQAIIPLSDAFQIGTPQGAVTIKNIYKTALGYDGEALVLRNNQQYEIIYNEEASAFGIHITAGPAMQVETSAENDLLSILGVTRTDLCKLQATEVVAPSVDPAGGVEKPLQLCTSAFGM